MNLFPSKGSSTLWTRRLGSAVEKKILSLNFCSVTWIKPAPGNNSTNSSKPSEPFYGSPRPRQGVSNQWSDNHRTVLGSIADTVATAMEQVAQRNPFGQSIGTSTSRIAMTLQQASIALKDPTRADAVAAVGEFTGTLALQKLQTVMQAHSTGRQILQERPLVSKATLPHQRLLREAADTLDQEYSTLTFGQAYGRFLHTHGFDPDERDHVRFIDNDELAYIMLRYRQSHDFYHALTGLPPTVVGELGLKWLELFQTNLPMNALAAVFGGFNNLSYSEQQVLWNIYLPWAQRIGQRQMQFGTLLNVYYEQEWDTPLTELQQRMGLELAPQNVEAH